MRTVHRINYWSLEGFETKMLLIDSKILNALREQRNRHFSVQNIKEYREYYDGKQKTTITDKQKEILENLLQHPICDNISFQVVKESAGRLRFEGWTTTEDSEQSARFLAGLYRTSDIQQVYLEARTYMLRDGNSVIMMDYEPDSESIHAYVEEWWDGFSGCFMFYDNQTSRPYIFLKEWSESSESTPDVYYCLLRTATAVYRFKSEDKISWNTYFLSPEETAAANENGAIPWAPEVFPFAHLKNGADISGGYGRSEIFRIIGQQDVLNDKLLAMSSCTRFTGFQMYWGSGFKITSELAVNVGPSPAGAAENLYEPYPAKFFTSPNPQSRFGVLPAGDIDKLIASYMHTIKRIAQISRIPLHTITGGDWPSGDALVRAELPAVNKAEEQLVNVEAALSSCAHIAIRIANTYMINQKEISGGIIEDVNKAEIITLMGDPERRDLIALSSALVNLSGYISVEEGLIMLGKSPMEITKIMRQRKEAEDLKAEREEKMLAQQADAKKEEAAKEVPKVAGGRSTDVAKDKPAKK